MGKGVFLHRTDSPYRDYPERQYQFPKRYLKRAAQCVGDWIVYYEPKKGGRQAYFAVARLEKIVEDPVLPDMHVALLEQGTYLEFDFPVPFSDDGEIRETSVLSADGTANRGALQWSVRPLSDWDFAAICEAGFQDFDILPRTDEGEEVSLVPGFAEEQTGFDYEENDPIDRPRQLVERAFRDRAFRRQVLSAYGETCALTGLKLINGGGRVEAEAAHIKPVSAGGPDTVNNGIALSGTVHWMFDRGLVSLSDNHEILISRQVNDPASIQRLIPRQHAFMPNERRFLPHPAYLSWHRENCFKC